MCVCVCVCVCLLVYVCMCVCVCSIKTFFCYDREIKSVCGRPGYEANSKVVILMEQTYSSVYLQLPENPLENLSSPWHSALPSMQTLLY